MEHRLQPSTVLITACIFLQKVKWGDAMDKYTYEGDLKSSSRNGRGQ